MSRNFLRNCLLTGFFYVSLFNVQRSYAQRYDFSASQTSFTPLAGATTLDIAGDEILSATIPIGFGFTYFGTSYSSVKISSNGFITFDEDYASANFSNSFASSAKIIAPLWDDLSGVGGAASYKLAGASGSRILTIQWLNWKWNYSSASSISFQAKLYEGTNKIEFIYRQENGIIKNPSATIGIVGAASTTFYSLYNTTASPELSPDGYDLIDTKPASNQSYTFIPNDEDFTAPAAAASAITVDPLGSLTATVSWTKGSGAYRAVFLKQTSSTTDLMTTEAGVQYVSSSNFGDSYAAADWYCVYNGAGNSVTITNLQSTYDYRIQIIEYNGLAGKQHYNGAVTGANFTTLLSAPIDPVSYITPYQSGTTELSFNVHEGNGQMRAVFIKPGATSGTAPVKDNTTYRANSFFSAQSQVDDSGWYCIYNGSSGTDITITGLKPNTAYRIHAVDYNGGPGSEKYYVSPVSNNPVQLATMGSLSNLPTYAFEASLGIYTPLAGGISVDNIEKDDDLSTPMPIGFTFYMGGTPVTEFQASSNGFLTFNPNVANLASANENNLSTCSVRPLVAPLWDDLSGTGGTASYSTTGTAPNRVFTMEFLNWKWRYDATGASISFQVKLYEVNNKIEYIYRPEGGDLSAPSASIGFALPNAIEGVYTFASLNNTSAAPDMSTAIETTTIATVPVSGQVYSFTPDKVDQDITFAALSPATYGDDPFDLPATTSSGLAIGYISSNTAVATVTGSTLTIVGIGAADITATQNGDVNYNAATSVMRTLTINKASQTILFAPLVPKAAGDADFDLTATSSSGLPVAYSSSNTAVATVSGNTVTIVGAGTTNIIATQAGDINYNAASSSMQPLVVKASQTITFGALAFKTVGDAAFELAATASSGLTVSYRSSNTAVATVSGSTVTIVGAGTTEIIASQVGNATYGAAVSVTEPLVVKANQAITFTEIPTKTFGDGFFALSASSGSSLAVTFTTTSDKVTISGSQVTIVKAGSVTIKADQAGNGSFNAAPTVEQTFCVNPAKPAISLSGLDIGTPVLTSSNSDGNQWLKEGTAISGATNTTFTPAGPGIYTVISTVDNCSSVSSEQQAIIVTAVEDITSLITVSPNPVQKEVSIDLSSLGKEADVAIFDLKGRLFHSSIGSKGVVTVNIASYDKGNYLVRVKSGARMVTKQITKN